MKKWLDAFRLKTLPLSLSSILMGGFLAKFNNVFSWDIFALAILTTIFLQILSNLANDYGDFVKGADNDERLGPTRALQSGSISKDTMKKAVLLFTFLSLISGIILLFISFGLENWKFIACFLGLGLASIWAAINYTAGKNAYGYKAMGDIFVFIFFGLVGVLGSYFLYAKTLEWDLLVLAISTGFLATGVLNINNIRDIESDKKVGKNTIPVLIGKKNAKIYHGFLILSAASLICFWGFLHKEQIPSFNLFPSIFGVASFFVFYEVWKNENPIDLNKSLRNLSLLSLIFTLLLGILILYKN